MQLHQYGLSIEAWGRKNPSKHYQFSKENWEHLIDEPYIRSVSVLYHGKLVVNWLVFWKSNGSMTWQRRIGDDYCTALCPKLKLNYPPFRWTELCNLLDDLTIETT